MKNIVQWDSTTLSSIVYNKKATILFVPNTKYSCTHLFLFVLITLMNKTTLFIVSLSLAIRKLKSTLF